MTAAPNEPAEQRPTEPRTNTPFAWRPCGALECAEVMVPLDPSDPDGEQIPIAINRRRVSNPRGPNLGVLMFNPGGPGASGKQFVAAIDSLSGLPFDVIGFDPRGVGDSEGLDCPERQDALQRFAAEGVPGALEAFRADGEGCRQSVGPLFDHLGTNAVVSDVEQIRIALGVEQISFYGISYGTRIGAAYAQRYPERIRALILDSPMPPTASLPDFVDAQFEATIAAHEALLSDCAQGSLPCPADASVQFDRSLRAFDAAGLRLNFLLLWSTQLASPPGRDFLIRLLTDVASLSDDQLDSVLMQAMMGSAPTTMLALPDVVGATNRTVNCTDSTVAPPSAAEAGALMATYEQRSELFAALALPAIVCSSWPAARDPLPDIAFRLDNPPLIIAGTADTLTPLPMAEELHAAIPGSVLLLSEHYGHGALSFGGECAGMAIGRYLGGLELPPDGTVCPAP